MTGSAPSDSAAAPLRWTSTLGWNHVSSPRSLTRCRHHHTRSLVRVVPGVITFDENIVCVIDHTSSCMRRKNASSSGSRTAMSSSGSPSASRKRDVQVSPSAAVIPFNSPLLSPSEKANTVDRLMPMTRGRALLDDGLQHLPLLVSPQLGLRAAAHVRVGRPCRAPGFEHAPLRRAAKRDALDARRRRAPCRPTRTCRRRRRSSGGARRTSRVPRSRANTGSSAYSRIGTTQRSMPCLRINAGRNVSRRLRSHSCCSAACSRSVPNGRSSSTGQRRSAASPASASPPGRRRARRRSRT